MKKLKEILISDLIPNPRNSKHHPPEQIENLAKSIERSGETQPILVDEENVILAGHGRLQALKKLGTKKTVVVEIAGLTELQKSEILITDNRISEGGSWNIEKLENQLHQLSKSINEDNFESIADLFKNEVNLNLNFKNIRSRKLDEQRNNPPKKFNTKENQVWKFGEQQIHIQSSGQKNIDDQIDLIIADPPYGIRLDLLSPNYGKKVKNDNNPKVAIDTFRKSIETISNRKKSIPYYIFSGHQVLPQWGKFLDKVSSRTVIIVWMKENATLQLTQHYRNRCEYIFYGHFPGELKKSKPFFLKKRGSRAEIEDLTNTIVDNGDGTYQAKLANGDIATITGSISAQLTTIQKIDEPLKNKKFHLTQKPVPLLRRFIENSSQAGDLIYDPFGGSFAVAIACHESGRRSISYEIDPKVANDGLLRIQETTGITPELI